jgi:hypothetical protein
MQSMVRPYLPDLQILHRRDMTCRSMIETLRTPAKATKALEKLVPDTDWSFEIFQIHERKSWKQSGLENPPPPEFLVRPSDSFSSPNSHRLNQPSFTTTVPAYGATADHTNGCIAMILGTAVVENTFVYDQVHRRDELSHGSTRYPPFVQRRPQEMDKQNIGIPGS